MRIRIESPVPRDVVVDVAGAGATVGDVARAVVPGQDVRSVHVDGHPVDPDEPLATGRLGHGSRLAVNRPDGGATGRRHGPAGAPAPEAGAPERLRREGSSIPLHRVLRPLPPPPPPAIPAPAALPPAVPPGPSVVIGLAGSLLLAGAMVWLLHSWTYAVLGLFGPVLAIAGALDRRRTGWRGRRRARRRRRRELTALDGELAAAADRERALRHHRYPTLEEAARAAAVGACWGRRLDHHDALAVRIGVGDARWEPPVTGAGAADEDVAARILAFGTLAGAAVGLDLRAGSAVAGVGGPEPVRGLARAVIAQAATIHGPADLRVAVLTSTAGTPAWNWCAWLPHVRLPGYGELLAADEPSAASVVDALAATAGSRRDGQRPGDSGGLGRGPVTIVVVDDPVALARRRSAVRRLLRMASDPAAGVVVVVVVPPGDAVPAPCRVVLRVDDGALRAPGVADGGRAQPLFLGRREAAELARSIARFDDPEVEDPDRGVPDRVALADVVPLAAAAATSLAAQWSTAPAGSLPAVVGIGAAGPVELDLVHDGPHLLVAGTTGSGKSELLRTLVASIAAATGPGGASFVLVDYKGGAAFDACADLPHVTGVVTDLDDHLAGRAVRCLEAELRRRERLLRSHAATDLAQLQRRDPAAAPPRLVVVVDELATLLASVPAFVDGLIDVGQRGRSLGLHLVLATQRPAGVVSERLRANVGSAIALRVLSAAESTDVIGAPDAARLSRHHPGRAVARLGPDELLAFQTAWSTAPPRTGPPVRLRPLGISSAAAVASGTPSRRAAGPTALFEGDEPSALERFVATARAAWDATGEPAPPCPWPAPLEAELAWPLVADEPGRSAAPRALPSGSRRPGDDATAPLRGFGPVVGLADHPDEQVRRPHRWRAGTGPLLAVGLPGSGTTTLAATAVLDATRRLGPDELHVHVVGGGDLVALAGLPHVGAVVGLDDVERQRRLVAELAADLALRRRRGLADPGSVAADPSAPTAVGLPRRLVVVDGLAALRRLWDDLEPSRTWERLLDVTASGSTSGLHVLVTAAAAAEVPHRLLAACAQRLVFGLADPAERALLGVGAQPMPPAVPGRAVALPEGCEVQVARPPGGLGAAVASVAARWAPVSSPPGWVGTLPESVLAAHLGSVHPAPSVVLSPTRGGGTPGRLALPLGVRDDDLGLAVLTLPPHGHALVAGPARSGRTNALRVLAGAAARQGWRVVVVTPHPHEWAGPPDGPPIAALLAPTDEQRLVEAAGAGPVVVLADHADRSGPTTALDHLVEHRRPDRHVIAAGRNDLLRGTFRGWIREIGADRCGLLLDPDLDLDGDLLGVRLPRHPPARPAPGRGHAVGLDPAPDTVVQVALADTAAPEPGARHRSPTAGDRPPFPAARLTARCGPTPSPPHRRNP